jgi:hypothetical protein
MAIAAKPSSPSGPPSAADWAAISVAAASETRVGAAAVVASAAIAITNDDDHPCDGDDVNNYLHDGYEDVIVDDGLPSLLFSSNDDKGNAFPTRHAPSNGKKFVSNNGEFFEASAQENKTKATAAVMMEAQREIPNKEEAYDEYACYDGSTMTMESCNDEECEERSSVPIDDMMYEDEARYKEELTNYTYERAVAY